MSTPVDMIRLGEAAMAIPAFAQIVAMPQVTLPLAGVVYNFDYDLGHDGIVGIKTGSDAADALIKTAFATVATSPVVPLGHVVGRIVTPWGASVAVTAGPSNIVGWPGLTVPATMHIKTLSRTIPADARIGELTIMLGGQVIDVPLLTSQSLRGPSAIWRITHA